MVSRPLILSELPAIQALADEAESAGFPFVTQFVADLDAGVVKLYTHATHFLGVTHNGQRIAISGACPDDARKAP